MKITAKLAYNQLKIKSHRSVWTLIAIILSTALTSAVCSFVASGNAMLHRMLGKHYGQYGSFYKSTLVIPAVLVSLLIVAMSVVVISNAFRVSAKERISQFGVLKCVGATGKQIKESVLYEGIFLSVVGIPGGLLLGLLFGWIGIKIANHYMDQFNALVHLMVTEIQLHISFVVSWKALLISAIISFLVVLYSAWSPARKAAKKTAVESVSGVERGKVSNKKIHGEVLLQRIFGYEGVLAAKNGKRSRHNFRATFIALSMGIILFICLGSLQGEAKKIEGIMTLPTKKTVIAEYMSNYDRSINSKTGEEKVVYTKPIDSELGNQITNTLRDKTKGDIFGVGTDSDTYHAVISEKQISEKMKQAFPEQKGNKYSFSVELNVLDAKNYEKLCKKAGVAVGSTILLNDYYYNNNGVKERFVPFSKGLSKIILTKADHSKKEIKVDGFLTEKMIPKEMYALSPAPIRFIVPRATVRGFDWFASPQNIEAYIKDTTKLLNEVFPTKSNHSYMADGFNTRVYRIEDFAKVMNIAVMAALVFLYVFSVLLLLIGFTNVISTLMTNVMMRAKEFAVLQSVGMTPEGLRKMLNYESIFCSLKALLFGVPIGIVITYCINCPIRKIFPIPYQFPIVSILLSTLGVMAITCGITWIAIRKLKSQNIIEAIRAER